MLFDQGEGLSTRKSGSFWQEKAKLSAEIDIHAGIHKPRTVTCKASQAGAHHAVLMVRFDSRLACQEWWGGAIAHGNAQRHRVLRRHLQRSEAGEFAETPLSLDAAVPGL